MNAVTTHQIAYGGRLLNLCFEKAMLDEYRCSASQPPHHLRDLAHSGYVQSRLDQGQLAPAERRNRSSLLAERPGEPSGEELAA